MKTHDTTALPGFVELVRTASIALDVLIHRSCWTYSVDSIINRLGHVRGNEQLIACFWGSSTQVVADEPVRKRRRAFSESHRLKVIIVQTVNGNSSTYDVNSNFWFTLPS